MTTYSSKSYELRDISDFFKKRSLFWSENFKKICVSFLTLYAFIICQVIIRPQYYINASLISAPVLILYQNVRGTLMKCQLCYHYTDNVSKGNCKFNENPKHLNVAGLSYQFLFYLI